MTDPTVSNERIGQLIEDYMVMVAGAIDDESDPKALACLGDTLLAIRELRALRDPKWKLVPVKITDAMRAVIYACEISQGENTAQETWTRLLSAAPPRELA